MGHLANALLSAAILGTGGHESSVLGSGWLLTVVFGIPTAALGYLAYRAQRARDQRADLIEREKTEKERIAAERAIEAAQVAAQNEHLRLIQDAQTQTMSSLMEQLSSRDEAVAARDIEITRLHALEVTWHDRDLEQRTRLRTCDDQRARYRRGIAVLHEQIVELGERPRWDERD